MVNVTYFLQKPVSFSSLAQALFFGDFGNDVSLETDSEAQIK